ncbi:hypothetical protein Tdes44962_MAKER10333, partial [Teratosphaeria destructans]
MMTRRRFKGRRKRGVRAMGSSGPRAGAWRPREGRRRCCWVEVEASAPVWSVYATFSSWPSRRVWRRAGGGRVSGRRVRQDALLGEDVEQGRRAVRTVRGVSRMRRWRQGRVERRAAGGGGRRWWWRRRRRRRGSGI